MSHDKDIFDLLDTLDIPVEKVNKPERERPDLLELYTRRSRKIQPVSDIFIAVASILTFGTIIFMSLVMCL